MFTKKFNNLSDSLIEAAAKTLALPIVNEASNEKPTINHLELSEEELNELSPATLQKYKAASRERMRDTSVVGKELQKRQTGYSMATKKLSGDAKVGAKEPGMKATSPQSQPTKIGSDVKDQLDKTHEALKVAHHQPERAHDAVHALHQMVQSKGPSVGGAKHPQILSYLSAARGQLKRLKSGVKGNVLFHGGHLENARKSFSSAHKLISGLKEEAGVNEGLRLVTKHTNGKTIARVYKNPDWNEYHVKLYHGGVHHEPSDYHTDDLEDALGTANRMIKEAELSPKQKKIAGIAGDPKKIDKHDFAALRSGHKMDEAKRGRPPAHDTEGEEDETVSKNPIVQLRKAHSLRSYNMRFNDGSTHKVSGDVAATVLHHFNSLKTADQKQNVQDKISRSHEDLMQHHASIIKSIHEARRGRPPAHDGDAEEDETASKHPIMQLRKAKSLRSYNMRFDDGSTHKVSGDVAAKVLHHYDSLKTADQKERVQNKISQSHDSLMQHHNEISEEVYVPKNGKMLLEPEKKSKKKELDEVPVETMKQVKMVNQEEEQMMEPGAPYAKRVSVPEGYVMMRPLPGHKKSEGLKSLEKMPGAKVSDDGTVTLGEPEHSRLDASHKFDAPVRKPSSTRLGEEPIDERHMSDAEKRKRERIVMALKSKMKGFKERYGSRAKDVMYATATKQAMKEETPKGSKDGVKINPPMSTKEGIGVKSTTT